MAQSTLMVPPAVAQSELTIDPVTRIGGSLGVHTTTDGERITDAHAVAGNFRGYETIVNGRDPRDVMGISSRACGWCGAVHQTTAQMALEMAWGIRPPPMAMALRNVAEATEAIWVHAAHLAVRAGPDWCGPVVRRTTPWLWDLAAKTEAPGVEMHGFKTIGELMESLTPVKGSYWWETIPAGRRVLEMINLMYGKYPHPSVLSPGTVGSTLTIGNFTEYYTRLYRSVDYVKKVIAMWDDLVDFLADADPRFSELGERPASFVHAGAWDDPGTYGGTWESLDVDGRRRLAGPGVILDGQLVTDRLRQVHDGITESVAHSFYADGDGQSQTPDGQPLPAGHPWGRDTVARPGARDYNGRYSWSTAPRWEGEVCESTPLGRLWLTALRSDFPDNDFIEPTGHSVRILVPGNFLPEVVVEWFIPERVNLLERLRADAYGIAFAGLSSAVNVLHGLALLRGGDSRVSTPFKVLDTECAGVGLWESGRGMNAHWIRTDRRVKGFQIVGPSTWNISPRDAAGRPGPLEEALIGSPLIEEPLNGRLMGIDVARVVHGFDPCMQCGTH